MSVPKKRRAKSKTGSSRSHKHLHAQSLSQVTHQDGTAAPHRLRAYIERHEADALTKRAERSERKIKAQAA